MRHQTPTARRLELIAADLTATAHDPDGVLARMHDALEGHPGAQSYDPGGYSDGTSTTERIALRVAEHGDRARTDRALYDRTLTRMVDDARTLANLTAAYSPRPATDKARREAERANADPDECAHTRNVAHRFEPVHRVSDCGGVLPAPIPLCRWVYDFTRSRGRLPSPSEMELHAQGRTVRLPA